MASGDLLAGRITKTYNPDTTVTTARNWYHLDHLNSTKLVTDGSGVVVVNYTYRAFGEQLKRMNAAGNETTDKAKYSYGGKELDDDTNLYYFNARYYDATTGRFINVDPIQDGTNWYVYCSNNPLSMVDPSGLIDVYVNGIYIDASTGLTRNPGTGSFPRGGNQNDIIKWTNAKGSLTDQMNARVKQGTCGIDESGPCYVMTCIGVAQTYAKRG